MTTNARLAQSLILFARAAAAVVALEGCLVLLGWAADHTALRSVFPGLVAMNPATAIAFILAGISLWLLSTAQVGAPPRRTGKVCACLVALIGLIKLGSFVGPDLGIDRLLFPDKLDAYSPPNRMAPNTALGFLVTGVALLLADSDWRRKHRLAELLAVAPALMALFAVLGYAYGVTYLYGIAAYIPMALNTAVAFCLINAGVLCCRPDRGLVAAISGDSAGGIMVCRLLPAALGIPAVLGWISLAGERAGLYDAPFGVALIVMVNIIVSTALIWWTTGALDRLDARRKRAEAERERQYRAAENARSETRAVLDAVSEAILFVSPDRRILTVNRRFTELFGIEADGVVGRRVAELQPDIERIFADAAGMAARVDSTAPDADQQFTEIVVQRWPERRELELWSGPVRGADGRYLGREYAFRDVTAQREVERLKEERRRQLEEDLARAAQVQAELLPRDVPALPGFELAARCLPAREVGGDFFDWHEPAPGFLTLTLGDVMGKGMPAALLMATVRAALESVARQSPPATAVQTVATALERDLESAGSFITLFHAQADIAARRVDFVDAGHGHTFLHRADGTVEGLLPRGLPLGVLSDVIYQEGSATLCPGDAMVIYSDGLVDARPDLAVTPSMLAERLDGAASALEIVDRLVALAAGSEPLPDDLTVMVLRCRTDG
ncbi:MAG: SpoIIE family protein phosphatase [Chloroflexota bacterium]|nr:SpoIIE family protein phosphatase [Chloroflexota bacterium]